MREVRLSVADALSAAAIQRAIDDLGAVGGRLVLPELEIELDRGLELHSNVELVGQGDRTFLRKGRGRLYPLAGYHNYGMYDVPLQFTDGLEPGMTVAVRDRVHGGFFETLARITWVDGTWVGLDCGLHSDYAADQEPVLLTSFPLVYGLGVENVAVRDLALDGNRDQQPSDGTRPLGVGACRGAAVYFIRSHHIEVSGITESGFAGEGLGFQMCSDVHIRRCHFARNAGNGYHPGAGSTGASFEECVAEDNDAAGFFFCVRANHITVRNCTFRGNRVCGVSVGTRDCYNRIERCQIVGNDGPGILFRANVRPVEVHSCAISGCRVAGNVRKSGRAQIEILGDAHDLILSDNDIAGVPGQERAGISVAPSAERIWLAGNRVTGCFPEIIGDAACLAQEEPAIACGVEVVQQQHFRHLRPGGSS